MALRTKGVSEAGTFRVMPGFGSGGSSVTATTVGSALEIAGARRVSLHLQRSDHSSGSTVWSVEGTIDGTNWEPINLLSRNVANANTAESETHDTSVTQNANGIDIVGIDLKIVGLLAIRVTATETTDGTHVCFVLIEH